MLEKVSNGQNIFDVVVSGSGNMRNLFSVLIENDLNVDCTLRENQEITIPMLINTNETFIITSNIDFPKDNFILSQQNLFDLTTQYYGDISLLFDFMIDNSFNIDTTMQSGSKIILHNAKKGNDKIKKFVILNNLNFANKMEPEIIPTPPTPSEGNIFAGTSPDGLILSSIDGTEWSNLGTTGKGNSQAFAQFSNGDLVDVTDQGWFINYTKGTSIKLSNYPIISLVCSSDFDIACADSNGDVYTNNDGGYISFTKVVSLGYRVNSIVFIEASYLFFTFNGIYDFFGHLIQSGNFTCACDAGSGVIYAGTTNGHIFKSINSGASWSDLGNKTIDGSKIIQILLGGTLSIIYFTITTWNTTVNDFSTFIHHVLAFQPNCNSVGITGGANGHIYINAFAFEDLGVQFSQTSINCLISVNV